MLSDFYIASRPLDAKDTGPHSHGRLLRVNEAIYRLHTLMHALSDIPNFIHRAERSYSCDGSCPRTVAMSSLEWYTEIP